MSILTELHNLESSTIKKLCYNGSVLGLRVKSYSLEERKFYYYDFEISYVKRKDLQDYLNKHSKEFESLELIEHNSILCTMDEVDGKIIVQEFKDEVSAGVVLDSVIKVLQGGLSDV